MRSRTALACLVGVPVTLAGAPAAAQISHQGQDISDHVVLRDGLLSGRGEAVCPSIDPSFEGSALFRALPDGTVESEPFAVPTARHLVITDVEWTVEALSTGFPLTAGATIRTRLSVGRSTSFNRVFHSRTVEVGPERGRVSGSDQLTTGFVVGANTTICPGSAEFSANTVRSVRLIELVLRGYLITTH